MSLIFSPHFDVFCDLLLNRRTATWNLFLLCTCNKKDTILQKSFFYFKIFLYNSKASLCLIYCLSKIKRSHWLLCAAKNCEFSLKIMSLPRLESSGRFLWNEVENYSDREGIFALRSQQTLQCWKNTLGKLVVAVNTGGHSIRVLNTERSVSPGSNAVLHISRTQFKTDFGSNADFHLIRTKCIINDNQS